MKPRRELAKMSEDVKRILVNARMKNAGIAAKEAGSTK